VNIWRSGANFLMTNDADRLLLWGRLPTLLLALLLAYFVYRWAKELYGKNAGLMALLLYAFCPTIIAHSSLASYDIGLRCFFTLSLYWFWRFMVEGTWQNLLWTGLLLGCALAFIGGPKFGLEYLDADLADWGQNLKRLKRYLDAHQFDRVKLLYVGNGQPEYYGIRVPPMQWAELGRPSEPGIYIMSTHRVVRARGYFKVD